MALTKPKMSYPEDFPDQGLPRGVFSWSQYDLYKKCPHRYKLKYIDGLPARKNANIVRGSCVHAGIERLHNSVIQTGTPEPVEKTLDELSPDVDEEVKSVEEWEGHDKNGFKDNIFDMVRHYRSFAYPMGIPNRVIPEAVERPFAIKFGVVPVIGFIDFVGKHFQDSFASKMNVPEYVSHLKQAGLEIPYVDVVSDNKIVGKTWGQNQVDIHPQLTLYSEVTGKQNVAIEQVVSGKRGVKVSVVSSVRTRKQVNVLVEDMEEVVYLIKRGIFDSKSDGKGDTTYPLGAFPKTSIDHWSCSEKWCPYWAVCRGK